MARGQKRGPSLNPEQEAAVAAKMQAFADYEIRVGHFDTLEAVGEFYFNLPGGRFSRVRKGEEVITSRHDEFAGMLGVSIAELRDPAVAWEPARLDRSAPYRERRPVVAPPRPAEEAARDLAPILEDWRLNPDSPAGRHFYETIMGDLAEATQELETATQRIDRIRETLRRFGLVPEPPPPPRGGEGETGDPGTGPAPRERPKGRGDLGAQPVSILGVMARVA